MNQPVTLTEMLDARERRALRQQKLLDQYQATLVCFTMNIAGPVKNSPLIRQGFALGNRWLKERLRSQNLDLLHFEDWNEPTGNEAYYVIRQPVPLVKAITTAIEDESALGRLFDLDVLAPDGTKADRTDLGLAPRRCLVCDGPAKACARSRAHSVEELQNRTTQILTKELEAADARDAARLACRALLYEVATTPKPGLVDRDNSGSHKDMDVFTFLDSASALWPYFEACTRTGRQTAGLPAADTFQALRRAGQKAEADMLAATRGVNTHKGAIFSMGILCGTLGRLPRPRWSQPEAILQECAAMTRGLVAADFAGLTRENACTTGQKLYLDHQISGVRGQMEAGLPAVRDVGLPVLRSGLSQGLSLNDAGCAALLALMTATTDTNLVARSSLSVQQETCSRIRSLLEKTPFPDSHTLRQLDQEFMEKNLSPGGSADLLAVCYLLHFLETEEPEGLERV